MPDNCCQKILLGDLEARFAWQGHKGNRPGFCRASTRTSRSTTVSLPIIRLQSTARAVGWLCLTLLRSVARSAPLFSKSPAPGRRSRALLGGPSGDSGQSGDLAAFDLGLHNAPTVRPPWPRGGGFHAAFGLGDNDKHIATVDAGGVALAAIQGLHQLLQQKDTRIAVLEKELLALQADYSNIEQRLASLESQSTLNPPSPINRHEHRENATAEVLASMKTTSTTPLASLSSTKRRRLTVVVTIGLCQTMRSLASRC